MIRNGREAPRKGTRTSAENQPQNDVPIVVVGASAGGVEALSKLVGLLPADLPAAIFVVLHVPATGSVLPQILSRAGSLPAAHARDGDPIVGGRIHVAPPDCHLQLVDGKVSVGRGPRENGHRPAIDPLFRSAARYGARVTGVILSGSLDDGAAGLAVVKSAGGLTVVQDPAEALAPSMPESAIAAAAPDHVLPIARIAELLARNGGNPGPRGLPSPQEEEAMPDDPTTFPPVDITAVNREQGDLTAFTCPECSGSLWAIREGELVKLRCRVGHAYTEETYEHEQLLSLEAALWTGLTALVEKAEFSRRLEARFRRGGHETTADRYAAKAASCDAHVRAIRRVLEDLAPAEPADEELRAS
jgi:two-component system chemotaxis response regulator CheB